MQCCPFNSARRFSFAGQFLSDLLNSLALFADNASLSHCGSHHVCSIPSPCCTFPIPSFPFRRIYAHGNSFADHNLASLNFAFAFLIAPTNDQSMPLRYKAVPLHRVAFPLHARRNISAPLPITSIRLRSFPFRCSAIPRIASPILRPTSHIDALTPLVNYF